LGLDWPSLAAPSPTASAAPADAAHRLSQASQSEATDARSGVAQSEEDAALKKAIERLVGEEAVPAYATSVVTLASLLRSGAARTALYTSVTEVLQVGDRYRLDASTALLACTVVLTSLC